MNCLKILRSVFELYVISDPLDIYITSCLRGSGGGQETHADGEGLSGIAVDETVGGEEENQYNEENLRDLKKVEKKLDKKENRMPSIKVYPPQQLPDRGVTKAGF